MAKVVGWKVWMLSQDGTKVEKHVGHTLDDWTALHDDGVLVLMLFYDAYSTITCRSCLADDQPSEAAAQHAERFYAVNPEFPRHVELTRRHVANQPWNTEQVCAVCGDDMSYDSGIRYRRVLMGNDYYALAPGVGDLMFLQADHSADLLPTRYPGAVIKQGKWTDDDTFKQVEQEAMADYNVTELGVTPTLGTSDV